LSGVEDDVESGDLVGGESATDDLSEVVNAANRVGTKTGVLRNQRSLSGAGNSLASEAHGKLHSEQTGT
jgi:hypothetical protein